MFKGIKKRLTPNRSGRNRRVGNGGREQGEASPREPPDKVGIKPTSPRQVHPVDQISPVPYARRSLERRSRTVPSSKNSPGMNATGYDRRTDSFCPSPNKDSSGAPPAYPTAPNICVTGGKIEFITPPGSTISSSASGNCSTLLSTPSLTPSPSPKGESPQRLRSTLPVNKTQNVSPSKRNAPRGGRNNRRLASSATSGSSDSPKSPFILPPAAPPSVPLPPIPREDPKISSPVKIDEIRSQNGGSLESRKQQGLDGGKGVRRSATMPVKSDSENELQTLREENVQVKKQLASLQQEFLKLQEYVKELQKEKATPLSSTEEERSTDKMLVERCSALEQVNAQLQADSHLQRQQYEKCLDKVASQVVQAILVQKTQQEQCERLSKKVEDLQKQNLTLSSFIVSKGKFQSLSHCRKSQLLPISLALSTVNSQSLPNTLVKAKAHCDTNKVSAAENSECWYNTKEAATSSLKPQTSRTHPVFSNSVLPSSGSSSLPQSRSSKKRSLPNQTSADVCWYDIIKSLQKGETVPHNTSHNLGDNHNLSSDSSSVDTEERSIAGQRRTLTRIEDTISTSSSGDDFHAVSFPTSRSQHQQGETTTCFPSSTASNSESLLRNTDCNLVSASSQCSHPVKGRSADITLDFLSQTTHQNVVVNFSLTNNTIQSTNDKDVMIPPTISKQVNSSDSSPSTNSDSKADRASSGSNTKSQDNETEAKSTEVIVKDEGYSTMSSDVQSEAKENVVVGTISTVEEEKGKSFEGENEVKESSPTGTLKNNSPSLETLKVEKSNNKKNLNLGVVSIKEAETSQPEYCDGLRVVYDDEDTNSDIFFVPISDEGDKYLRHSFNFPFPEEPIQLHRCSSDSYLYKLFVRFPNCSQSKSKKLSINQNTLQSLPLKKRNQACAYNTYLRRTFRKETLKKGCLKLFNRHSAQAANMTEGRRFSNSINYDFLSQVFPPSISHPRILSPSYSHAEMEDWSLDLSGEDLTTPGGTEPSVAESSAPSHHLSQPSIQEATLELEEDHNDFLWNGTTYFKADDNDLSWPYDNKSKAWDLNLVGNKQCRSMISPKSGCSDQPAMWSSSEQLSCCSDIASKCSTDIENFCEQLCNLPELKRLSLCSSENGGNESHPSNSKLNEIDCNEDNSEIIEDINVETVFTRDFYRLVKFESTKSLTASSKSLATSEGFLTLERLKGLESLQNNKTLASVLGFIAEQQKYCNDREVMDENASFGPMSSKVEEDKDQNSEVSFQMQISEDSQSNNEMENVPVGRSHRDDNVLTSSESLSCLDLDSEMRNSFSCSRQAVDAPPKPKRSTSLNLGVRGGRSYRSRGTLPPLPSSYSPPPIPSRSTSRSTLPHQNAAFRPFRLKSRSPEIPEEPFPPPPPPVDDSYVEPYHAIPMEPPVPKVPLHRTPIPNLPHRSSSISRDSRFATNAACASPPVPKRITSRALPTPPPISIPPRSTSLENSNSNQRQSMRHNRPRSLLKEATVSNAINKNQGRQRGSCGDLGPLCRNSATLMLELQKMAKAEEEEKGSSGFYSPEATSPGTEVGLGTGWVRVEPVSDLGDPQTRANLLDTMLQSSEGCSSETDEDLAKQLQHTELLKVVQRNRRKRKASRHSGNDPMRVVGWCHQSPRPTILGRHSLFTRYGEEEESALKEFQFLESFPSQSDILVAEPPSSTVTSSYVYSYDEDEPCPFYTPIPYNSNIYARPTTNLKDLRSSEPCQDTHNYPLSSVPPAVESNIVPYPSSSNYSNDRRARHGSSHFSDRGNPLNVSNENSLFSSARRRFDSDQTSFQKHSKDNSYEATDNKPLYQNVPSPRPSNRCSNDKENKKEVLSVSRQSELKQISPNSELKGNGDYEKVMLRSNRSKIPMKCEEEIPDSRKSPEQIPYQRERSDERDLIDTRSLGNVKATIQKLNCRNQSSGKFQSNSGSNRISNSDTQNVPSHFSKPFSFLSTKPRPPLALDRPSEKSREFSPSYPNDSTSVNTGSPNSKRTPKLPGSNLVKRLAANSSASREPPTNAVTAAALPPKGSSSPRPKEKQGGLASKLPPKYGAFGKGMRSPRLPRFKLGRNRPDPLDAFAGKNLCDSGSSECSDKGFGRLSISDSCAEIFSPGESGDEVFPKHQ